MKHFLAFAYIMLLAIGCFSQSTSTVDRINNIPVNELYRGNLQLPDDFPISSLKYFNILTESLNQITVNLLDETQSQQYKISINYDINNKVVEYKITDKNANVQWVKVTYSFENGKDIANAVSSSNQNMKITTTRGQTNTECTVKNPVSDIQIILNNQTPKAINETDFNTPKGKSILPSLMHENEEVFYDTSQLKVLQNTLYYIDRLQGRVMEESLDENSSQLIQGPPRCSVFCVRIGTVIPIYACSDELLNCKRCGVNGVYLLGGFGCFAICAIPCSSFYLWA